MNIVWMEGLTFRISTRVQSKVEIAKSEVKLRFLRMREIVDEVAQTALILEVGPSPTRLSDLKRFQPACSVNKVDPGASPMSRVEVRLPLMRSKPKNSFG